MPANLILFTIAYLHWYHSKNEKNGSFRLCWRGNRCFWTAPSGAKPSPGADWPSLLTNQRRATAFTPTRSLSFFVCVWIQLSPTEQHSDRDLERSRRPSPPQIIIFIFFRREKGKLEKRYHTDDNNSLCDKRERAENPPNQRNHEILKQRKK